jgi:acyl-[acyl-carrier-protein]-phospholipid O-acyltransferase/long-chain-fatty-acid--[acyl-carrier-protein] ligase
VVKDIVGLLKTKRFLPLFVTQFLGAFNDNAFKNAFLIWFTFDVAQKAGLNANMLVTLAAGLFILPFFLFSATAGQLADKYEKSLLVRRIKMIEIVLMMACAAGFYMQSVYFLLVVLFLMGVQSTFFGPIKYSLLPEHLKDDELIAGNGLIEGGTFLSILLGTIFGGLIIRTEYGVELIAIAVITFSVLGWWASRFIPKAPVSDPDLNISWNIAAETWRIIGYARKERSVWLSIVAISWFWFVGATFLTQFPVYAKEVVGGNEHVVTLFLTVFSIGIGVGSMLCNSLLKGEINGRLVPWGCLGMSIFIIDFYFASEAFMATTHMDIKSVVIDAAAALGQQDVILLGLGGFFEASVQSYRIMFDLLMLSVFSGVYIVPLYAIMQHRSDEKYLSRIIASNNVLNSLFMVVASLGVMALYAAEFEVSQILLVVGLLNLPVLVVVKGVVKKRLSDA